MLIGIVGGGISGLYCALKLSPKHKVILIDERDYLGGRIKTHESHVELGAARFNKTHTFLFDLIKRYHLHAIKLRNNYDYMLTNEQCVDVYKDANKAFDTCIQNIINKTNINDALRNISFYDHCKHIIGKKETDLLVSVFGYYTEIKELNAYDAIQTFQKDFISTDYYVLEEGLSTLCDAMAHEIVQNGAIIYNNEKVIDATPHMLTTTKRTIKNIDKIIFCTKAKQMSAFTMLNDYSHSLYHAPLLRIYAKYKTPWFKDLNRITTNNVLRQIIPIDVESGMIMVSYSDGKDTEPFIPLLKKEKSLIKMIQSNLTLLFPDLDIPYPDYIIPYFWEIGTHAWKPGVNSDQIYKEVIHPLENVYVCGEAYSKQQAWMEGGLKMAQEVITKIEI